MTCSKRWTAMRRLDRYGSQSCAETHPSSVVTRSDSPSPSPRAPMQAALDAMEAYYVKVKTEQRQLQERLDELEAANQALQAQLQTLTREHSQCTNSK